ncbi:SCP2 sterol-binding domain-containing protein, partial [Actibacterium sp.]|uniref:SCP2 sterol-binding domain-containing protein n=1 Tax=Actibacterium sp. TaxID=1872125 RepID=UPI003562707F
IMVDGGGVHAGDDDADVTLTATRDTFEALLAGELNPASAFMSGKLKLDGDMGMAMRLGAALG